MATYTIAEAEGRLDALVDEATAGEPVTLTRGGKSVAELRPIAPPSGTVTPEMLELLASARAMAFTASRGCYHGGAQDAR